MRLVSTTDSATVPDIYFSADQVANKYFGTRIAAGTLDLGGSQRYIFNLSGHNSISRYNGGEDARISSSIIGSGGITYIAQNNDGTAGTTSYMEADLTLAGSNTFTGPLQIGRGSVYLQNSKALNGNAVTFASTSGQNAALFLYGNSITIGNLSSTGTGGALIANGNVLNGSNTAPTAPVTLTVNETANSSFNGVIVDQQSEYDSGSGSASGALSVVKTGSATLTLAASASFIGDTTAPASVYSGSTSILAGALILGSSTALGAANSIAVASGATLSLGGNNLTASSLVGSGVVQNGSTTTASLTIGVGGTFSGVIQNGATGSLAVVIASGSETFTGSNTYTGGTTLDSATSLTLGTGSASGSIVGSVADSGSLIFDRPDVISIPAIISGVGTVAQNGTGTVILSGANTYTGATTVTSGFLAVSSPSRRPGCDAGHRQQRSHNRRQRQHRRFGNHRRYPLTGGNLLARTWGSGIAHHRQSVLLFGRSLCCRPG